MKVSISWLKEFVNIKESPEKLAELLSLRSLETEVINSDTLEVEVTPNRGDCLSHLGIARELKAIYANKCK
ncbi:MAG: hypothetical protein ABIG90_00095 [bacterium]